VSAWIRWPGYLAWTFLALIALSVLTVRSGAWQQGLLLYAIAGLLSLVILATYAVQFLLPRFQDQRGAILHRALPALPGAALFVMAMQAGGVPAIHDITTDVDDPPIFETAPALRGDTSNPLSIKPEVIAQQLEAYPDLNTLRLGSSFENTYNRALTTARAMGWEITREDPTAGYIEAVDTTAIMNFKDDVVIRVRTNADGSIVDLRSVSRVGRSDLGANARRIRAYLRAFEAGQG
jgi:uncharacterized protein (DUF1499 family)